MPAITDQDGNVAQVTPEGELMVRSGQGDSFSDPSFVDVARSTPVIVEGTGSAVQETPIPPTEVNGRHVSVQIKGTFSATWVVECSNDSITWVSLNMVPTGAGSTTSWAASYTSAIIAHGPCPSRYFRVRISSYTSGTIEAIALFSALPTTPQNVSTVFPAAAALSDTVANPSTPMVGAALMGWDGSTWRRPIVTTIADGATANLNRLFVVNVPQVWTGSNYDRPRTPGTFKSALLAATGNIWTPTSGKKFRLMGYSIEVTGDAARAVAGRVDLTFRDGAGGSVIGPIHSLFVPTLTGTTMGLGFSTGWVDLGNGYLSSAANNVLELLLSAALTSGAARIVVAGTEE